MRLLTKLSPRKTTQRSTFCNGMWLSNTKKKTLFKSVLDKINLVGHDGHALFFVDKDLAEMAKSGGNGSVMTDANA